MVSVTYLPNADNICVPGCSWSSFPGDPGIYERLFPSLILFDDFFFIIFFPALSPTPSWGREGAEPHRGMGRAVAATSVSPSLKPAPGRALGSFLALSLPAAPSPSSPPVSLLPPAAVPGSQRSAALGTGTGPPPRAWEQGNEGASSWLHLPGHGGSCWARG